MHPKSSTTVRKATMGSSEGPSSPADREGNGLVQDPANEPPLAVDPMITANHKDTHGKPQSHQQKEHMWSSERKQRREHRVQLLGQAAAQQQQADAVWHTERKERRESEKRHASDVIAPQYRRWQAPSVWGRCIARRAPICLLLA